MTLDKAKVEQGVLLVERWILAALRKRQFFSLGQLNEEIRKLLDKLNQKPFRKLPGSRIELYEKLDRPALASLPRHPYVFAQWKGNRLQNQKIERSGKKVCQALHKRLLDLDNLGLSV